jgi:hypothetical protein
MKIYGVHIPEKDPMPPLHVQNEKADWFLIAFAVIVVLSFIISPFIQYGVGWIIVFAVFFFIYKVIMFKNQHTTEN